MALGAQPGDVMRQVVRRGLALTVIGLAIGLIVATMTMRSVRGLLFWRDAAGSNDVPGCFPTVRMCRGARVVCAGPPRDQHRSACRVALRIGVRSQSSQTFRSSYNPSSSAVTLSSGTRLGVYEIIAFDGDGMSAAPVSHKPEFGIGQPRQLFAIKSRCQGAGRDGTSTQAASAFF